jgi:hypothetical protein
LTGLVPTELGSLAGLQILGLCKFATVSSSEFDTIILLGSLSYNLFPLRFPDSNQLTGLIPTELGRLTMLETLDLCKFATVYSSELDRITLLGSLSYKLSPLPFCRA